jgi:hypothetical protein
MLRGTVCSSNGSSEAAPIGMTMQVMPPVSSPIPTRSACLTRTRL